MFDHLSTVPAVLSDKLWEAVRTQMAVAWKVCCTVWQHMTIRGTSVAGGAHWVPRLLSKTAEPPSAQLPEPSAVVETSWSSLLITGGLGSLGMLFALYGLFQVYALNTWKCFLSTPSTVAHSKCNMHSSKGFKFAT